MHTPCSSVSRAAAASLAATCRGLSRRLGASLQRGGACPPLGAAAVGGAWRLGGVRGRGAGIGGGAAAALPSFNGHIQPLRPLHVARAAAGAAGSATEFHPSGKKLPPPPTLVMPGALPPWEVWENAVILVDKPQEWTSFDVCGKLKGTVNMKKIGHAGTLDPMATGLLVVCLGKGTKRVDLYQAMEKEYSGTFRLGEGTDSYDADGEVVEDLPWEHITDAEVEAARDTLLGPIEQVPPMHSAIKIGGQRLYKLAREGKEVERPARAVTIESFEVARVAPGSRDFNFRIVCSKGTYIRSLAHDLGKAVGSAAHLTALRREAIGDMRVNDAWQLEDLVALVEEAGGPPWPWPKKGPKSKPKNKPPPPPPPI